MDIAFALKAATLVLAFVLGVAMVYRLSGGSKGAARAAARAPRLAKAVVARPASQLPLRAFEDIVTATETRALLISIERKTRLSQGIYAQDCMPVLEALAEFVQMLPASESHHHAHPGGLWQHLLEVADVALSFRAGLELPPGAGTEERKRLEHRWTYAVFVAALLHDVGKAVTDVQVTLYGDAPRDGKAWTPLAGSMRTFGAHWYTVAFADPTDRDYQAHAKLGAMLMSSFVPARATRWLADESQVLSQLVAYLSGEGKDGLIGSLIKRADSDSVRRNLLQGPRTRFASARTRPLVERLMEALRRMLIEGGSLPLNRPGAAGWVHDGKVWFVCARLADEVRSYLSQHESLQGIPGKDKNDRIFDTWQEYGAAETAPDGGAVWRVRVECDGWSPPDAFTVLCFALDKLFADPAQYPAAMKGRVWLSQPAAADPGREVSPAPREGRAAPPAALTIPPRPAVTSELQGPTARPGAPAGAAVLERSEPKPAPEPSASASSPSDHEPQVPGGAGAAMEHQPAVPVGQAIPVVAPSPAPEPQPAPGPAHVAEPGPDDGMLSPSETAVADLAQGRATSTPELGKPLRPRERGQRPAGAAAASGRTPSPAATAFMAWVAQSVGTGDLKYNEDSALVHFVPEGALLLSPEIFRRFLSQHQAVADGPIAELRQSHGDRAFARLQNELAKSGWTVRNGDENMHYYAFVKADKALSRTASFCLVGKPELFWNPVPAPNSRITRAPRPRRMSLPAEARGSSPPTRGSRSDA
ncbi:HD domain-containing protein [Rubrivivax sp. A210]|uniref:MobH family relaxase n=1 Tax=Rubrivivax sp. A210 TaxID=2772301 RepID=UPI001918FEA8|nr:MobH family relaxase [Rubrivivax sp. A210]CAD5366891.1 HD domain-containing protein [Rubrivivax sp. A210]